MSLFEFLERLETDPFDPALTAFIAHYGDNIPDDKKPEEQNA